jgi:acetyl-CoA carboxylase biotin carboxyl carrier protein
MSNETSRAPDGDLIHSMTEEVRDLIKRLEGSTVQRLAVQAGEYRIEIERGAPTVVVSGEAAAAQITPMPVAAGEAAAQADRGHPIVAPLVGTFYRSAKPGSPPFVEEGDVVDSGQTVGIVEAMKIMNEVKADRAGRVAEIAANEGEWVEFQQVLMYLEAVGG